MAWHDAENRVLWTEDTAPGAASLQDRLAAGDCDLQAAENLGRLLGAVHHAGIGETPPLWGTWEADAANWERFLRMRTTGVLARAELPPEAERAVHALSEAARRQARRGMVSHLDAAPKNALVQPDGRVALLDFELGAAVSDPAYDVGFLTGHYRLMGEALPALRDAARQAAAALTWAYRETGPAVDSDWERRVDRYAGVTLLYRLYGSSPAPYLSPECWPQVRREGLRLLLEGDA